MPLTLIATEGLIPKHLEQPTIARLCEAFLRLHGLSNNQFLLPNVIGHVQSIPQGSTFSAMEPAPVAIVEWLLPSFAFTDREVQRAYVKEATDIVQDACGPNHPRQNIWVNVKHAVDGPWGIAGVAHTNAELGALAAQG